MQHPKNTLRDKIKQRRAAESIVASHDHADIITPEEIAKRNRLASIDARHPYEMCAVCSENLAPRRYFLSPRKHFPICGNCLTLAISNPPEDMDTTQAIHYLQTLSLILHKNIVK